MICADATKIPITQKVDFIYIDPPYNTGATDWKYNNKFVDTEDSFRHSKWLNMMYIRLKIAKELMTDEGLIVVAIDDHELFNLGLMLDQLLGEQNRIGVIPVRNNPEVNKLNLEKVFNDKQNEAANGMDGTWVAHPGLINTALQAFKENALIIGDNQIVYKPQYNISESDLLKVPEGVITEKGILENINALVLYLHSWLNGRGAVAINNKMEDAATAEISRLQLWQWIYHNKKTNEGKEITYEYVEELTNKISSYEKINDIFLKMISKEKPDNFLTTELVKFL